MTKHQINLLLLPLVACCFAVSGCRQPDTEGHARVRTKNVLISVCKLVELGESITNEPPPTTLPSLVTWLWKYVSKDEPYINYREKTIKDAWGSVIVIVSQNGKFIGVGSPGPNRTWQDGAGDDILVKLEDVK